jgi:catechol 2,3-dioxygenase-like lactoylglutathione lyase family enzyme
MPGSTGGVLVHKNPILNVSDLQSSIKFYTEVLDFELLDTIGGSSRCPMRVTVANSASPPQTDMVLRGVLRFPRGVAGLIPPLRLPPAPTPIAGRFAPSSRSRKSPAGGNALGAAKDTASGRPSGYARGSDWEGRFP